MDNNSQELTEIMIVEDEALIAIDLETQLKTLGYSILASVPSGEEALEQIKKKKPHLILMDIQLKGKLDGIEAAKIIHDNHDIPIIYLSASTDPVTIERVKLSFPFGYVFKPFNERSLNVSIEIALYKHKADLKIKRSEELLAKEKKLLEQRVKERTDALLEANIKLEYANKMKNEFLANMSHELRTPLNAVLGMCEILEEGIAGELALKQKKYVTSIWDSGKHLLSLINDILDVAKIEAGKLNLHIQPTSVTSICEASMRFIKQQATQKGIHYSTEIDNSLSIILADGLRLKQILVNLLSNAVKFTPNGGKIGLRVSADRQKKILQLHVWDTGPGIPKDKQKLIFKPFVQMDSGLNRRHEGSGLGLALSLNLTELHGGTIQVESEPDQGSTFTVNVPLKEITDDQREAVITQGEKNITGRFEHNDKLVLLAEDNDENIHTIKTYLEARGYRVITATNGNTAYNLALDKLPDIILMDIQMPDMDGIQAIRLIRSHDKLKKTPILALTALAMLGDKEKCLTAGANDYLSKPISLKRLAASIKNINA